jgi:cytochrome P450
MNGEFVEIWPKMRKEDGSFVKVANWGPQVNGYPYLFISDRDAIQQILSSKDDFPKNPALYDDLFAEFLGNGLVTSKGSLWNDHRKLMTPFFHFKSLEQNFGPMLELTKQFVEELRKNDGWIPANDTFKKHSASVIIKLAFGDAFDSEWVRSILQELSLGFNYWSLCSTLFTPYVWNRVPHKYGSGFMKKKREIHHKIYEVIKRTRASSEVKPDLLGFLCHAKYEDGNYISDQLIADECFTFFFAGQDTTAGALCWMLYFLTKHPDVVQKIRQEISSVIGEREITAEDTNNLPYCNNVVKETLRIQPTTPFLDRIAAKDCVLAGVPVRKNTPIGVGIYPLHHDPAYWKDPDLFMPERWDDPSSKKSFIWVPFSAGHRNCIGMKFGTQEVIVGMVMILKEFDVSMNTSKKVLVVREGVITPHNLEFKFTPRVK